MSSFAEVASAAQSSWRSNYTALDKKWRLPQLHGLHQLVLHARDSIVAILSESQSVSPILYEREIAIFVKEIHCHISRLEKEKSRGRATVSAHAGKINVFERPVGVALILCNSPNYVRHGLAPLAASIAAGNVVILATSLGSENRLIRSLQKQWRKYLDSNTIFFVPGISTSEIQTSGINHISIFDADEMSSEYASLMQSPRAHFYSTSGRLNFAIVDEGAKDLKAIVSDIHNNSTNHKLPSDRLSAVFIRKEDLDALSENLTVLQRKEERVAPEPMLEDLQKQDCSTIGTDVFCLDLATRSPEQMPLSRRLIKCLQAVENCGGLLLVAVTSLDETLDLILELDKPIKQLTLFSPGSEKHIAYVRDWIPASTFFVGRIGTLLKPDFEVFLSEDNVSIYPTALFSRSQITVLRPSADLETSVPEIRAAYAKMIPPPRPEPRGERIGFFVQVEYLVKGVTIVTAAAGITGMYLGVRALQRRW